MGSVTTNIREETERDREAIRGVNCAAFEGEDEANLVDALRTSGFVALSIVAEIDGAVVGHLLFSNIRIISADGDIDALSLAPMAVHTDYQRQGIGTQLVKEGLAICRRQGHKIVLVLGHPTYYPRFGFSSELAAGLICPFGGGDAWMALELAPGALRNTTGRVEYSIPFHSFE